MPACLSVSAASNPGQLMHDALYSKLCSMKGHVDKKVVDPMVRFFAAAIPLASQQPLSKLYDLAKASPLSNTKDILRKDEGLLCNNAFVAGIAKASPLSNTKDFLRKDEGLLCNNAFVAGIPSRCATINQSSPTYLTST